MSRVAVIGAGISGLATAWLLSRQHDVILFERDNRLGGHTHTHHIDTPSGPLALDTGFLVHNDRTYPLLVRLFDELGVERLDSDMSFGVSDGCGEFEYSTRNLNGLFADRRNLVRPGHYRLLLDILRFNREARAYAAEQSSSNDTTLGEFLETRRLRGAVVDRYLLPLAAAIWSAPTTSILDFPALTLIRFFAQHGMITTFDHPVWKVVKDGSATYIPKLLASPRISVKSGTPVTGVRREATHLTVTTSSGLEAVDHVVFACHGDEILPIFENPTEEERRVLSAFRTSTNVAVLHTDSSWLPRRPAAGAAWNYRIEPGAGGATVTYDLNRLQGLRTPERYCVTLNPTRTIEPYHVLRQMTYAHPLYTRDAVAAQDRWDTISGRDRVHFCGAYWFYGFHEDGLRSAVRVANRLGVEW